MNRDVLTVIFLALACSLVAGSRGLAARHQTEETGRAQASGGRQPTPPKYPASKRLQNPANGHEYQRIDVSMPWHEAKRLCEELGGHLATATSAQENEFIYNGFATDHICWLGGTDEQQEGNWRWVTGEPFEFTNWSDREPNNSSGVEHYVTFGNRESFHVNGRRAVYRPGLKWNDHMATGEYHELPVVFPVCEWDSPPPEAANRLRTLPDGGVEVLQAFLDDLKAVRPDASPTTAPLTWAAPQSLRLAAEKILAQDRYSAASQTALRVLLEDRVGTLGYTAPQEQREAVAAVRSFLQAKHDRSCLDLADVHFALWVARVLDLAAANDTAKEAYERLGKLTTDGAPREFAEAGRLLLDRLFPESLVALYAEPFRSPPYAPQGELEFVNLSSAANWALSKKTFAGGDGNNLAELPVGEQTLGGVRFRIADRFIQLRSKHLPELPAKVERIPIGRKLTRLYVLQGTQWGTGDNFVQDGAVIGEYRVHYEDSTLARIPIAYGENVRDWWKVDQSRTAARAEVAWTGMNALSRATRTSLRLYVTAWENPRSEKKVVSIDFVSANTVAAPFCVAMTVEEGKPIAIAKTEVITNSIGMKLALIPAGKFLMGSPDAEAGRNSDEKQHEVRIIRPFHLGVYEVTQAEYERVMGTNPSHFSVQANASDEAAGRWLGLGRPGYAWRWLGLGTPGGAWRQVLGLDTSRFPVERVWWQEAVDFCTKLSALPDERAAGRVYRLPTEAEWEYACRAGTTTPFHFGAQATWRDANLETAGLGLHRPTLVGYYPPNAFGLYDMHGNVSEWVAVGYGPNYYTDSQIAAPPSPTRGFEGPVHRGGSFLHSPEDCRAASRGKDWGSKYVYLGFRVVLAPAGSGLTTDLTTKILGPAPAGVSAAEARMQADAARRHWAELFKRTLEITNSIGMRLTLIPPGEFLMGSPATEAERSSDETQHPVRITKPFYLGVHEVTQGEFEQLMGTNPSYFSATANGKDRVHGFDTRAFPVEQVTWDEAGEFCRKLSSLPAERSAGRVYRLPTEAEWEYACRAGTTTPPTHLFMGGVNLNANIAYGTTVRGSFQDRTTKVGLYDFYVRAYAFSLSDMHGNVAEWCADWYGAFGTEGRMVEDPKGPAAGSARVHRGGSWFSSAASCRCAARDSDAPSVRSNMLGFRVAVDVPDSPAQEAPAPRVLGPRPPLGRPEDFGSTKTPPVQPAGDADTRTTLIRRSQGRDWYEVVEPFATIRITNIRVDGQPQRQIRCIPSKEELPIEFDFFISHPKSGNIIQMILGVGTYAETYTLVYQGIPGPQGEVGHYRGTLRIPAEVRESAASSSETWFGVLLYVTTCYHKEQAVQSVKSGSLYALGYQLATVICGPAAERSSP